MSGMLFRPDASFQVEGFIPPPRAVAAQLGGWSVGVSLHAPFAREAMQHRASYPAQARLEARVYQTILSRMFSEARLDSFGKKPILTWHEDTLLLTSIEVPGINGCLLYVEPSDFTAFEQDLGVAALYYGSHNVDTMEQSTALLSCWLSWHRAVTATLRDAHGT